MLSFGLCGYLHSDGHIHTDTSMYMKFLKIIKVNVEIQLDGIKYVSGYMSWDLVFYSLTVYSLGWLRPVQCIGTDTQRVPIICNTGCCVE